VCDVGTCDVGTCPVLATCPAVAGCVSEQPIAALPRAWNLVLLAVLLLGAAAFGLRAARFA
jgi:hypothetical protein